MHLTRDDLRALVCPKCHGAIRADADRAGSSEITNGFLDCRQCGRAWRVNNGIAEMLDTEALSGSDVWLRPIYDVVAPWHDLGVTLALPWMQFPDFGASRERYMRPLDLESLQPRGADEPLRVLEVGVGSGGNLPLIDRHLRSDLDVEIWGLDFSRVMLFECRRRLPWYTSRPARLVLGDAHELPFGDATFDRVFHVGGINGYRDPRAALAEMARVARRDTPIVVVDEQLDPARVHLPHHYLSYRALTWLNTIDGPPVDQLPADATDVEVRPVSRFYYCLKFRMPEDAGHDDSSGDGDRLRDGEPDGAAPQNDFVTTPIGGENTMATPPLTDTELQTIQTAYSDVAMNAVLRYRFDHDYPPTGPWLDALTGMLINLPDDCPADGRQKLSAADRQRCIVTLLCSRGERVTLAIHMYMALCLKVEHEELKHILFLTGVYSGVPNFARGLIILEQLILAIRASLIAGASDPASITTAILARIPV